MAYSLLCSHTDTDVPTVTSEHSKYLTDNCNYKYSSDIPSTVKPEVLSCPGSDCPGDACMRCQDSAVTIDNRCVCLCQTADCPHRLLRFRHYLPFDQLCRPPLHLQGYRLLENMYSSATGDEETRADEGTSRFTCNDSSSSDDDTSSSESSSSSSYSSHTTSSSSSSSSSESIKDSKPTCS